MPRSIAAILVLSPYEPYEDYPSPIYALPGRGRGPIHHFFSEFFDWNDPPLLKNFLQIDASPDEVRIRCFAATDCVEHEEDSPLEDEVRIPLS